MGRYFLAEAARVEDLAAFNHCVVKFAMVLRRDQTFRTLLGRIREVVFDERRPEGIFGLFSQMLEK